MAYIYKNFPFCDVLTMISGKMVAARNTTDTLYDMMQHMLNDDLFSVDARAEAPRRTMLHFEEKIDEVTENLKRQFPELVDFEIPNFKDPDMYRIWSELQELKYGKLRVRSLDRY